MANLNFSNIKGAASAQKAYDLVQSYDKPVFAFPHKTKIQVLESGETAEFHTYATEDNPYLKVRATEPGKDPIETFISGRGFWNLQVQIDQNEKVPTWSTDRSDKVTNLKSYVKNNLDIQGDLDVSKMEVEIVGWFFTDVKDQLVVDTREEHIPQLNITYYVGYGAFKKAANKWRNSDPATREQGVMGELYEALVNTELKPKGVEAMRMDFNKDGAIMDEKIRKAFTTTPTFRLIPNQ